MLYLMVRDLKPKRILEVGAGGTTLYMALGVEKNQGGVVFSFDVDQGKIGYLKDMLDNEGLNEFVEFVKGDVKEEAEPFLRAQIIDILFIDNEHTYEFGKWWTSKMIPYVRDGGLIAVHDILSLGKGEERFYEWKAVKEMLDANPSWEFLLLHPLYNEDFLSRLKPYWDFYVDYPVKKTDSYVNPTLWILKK